METAEVFVEFHETELVTSCVLPSLYFAVAMNCCVEPLTIEGVGGVTEMETSAGAAIASEVDPVTGPNFAWMAVVPWVTPVARPALVIVALPVLEVQATE